MKALRYYGVKDVRCEDIPEPMGDPGADEVLIRIVYGGICGSDLHIYNKGMFIQNIPETMGHEFVGQIEKLGANVKEYQKGDCVTANPMVPCMKCPSCQEGNFNTCGSLSFLGECTQGCFTGYITVKADKLIGIPAKEITQEMALIEPLAVALNVCKRAELCRGDKIAVVGAGPIGLLVIQAAKVLYGVKEITAVDVSDARLQLAGQAGATHAQKEFEEGERYDKIIEAAGVKPTFQAAVAHVKENGCLYVVSIFEKQFEFDINDLVAKQITLVGCNVYTQKEMEEAAEYIAQKKLELKFLISRIYDLSEGKDAFELLSSADKAVAKVLFRMN